MIGEVRGYEFWAIRFWTLCIIVMILSSVNYYKTKWSCVSFV